MSRQEMLNRIIIAIKNGLQTQELHKQQVFLNEIARICRHYGTNPFEMIQLAFVQMQDLAINEKEKIIVSLQKISENEKIESIETKICQGCGKHFSTRHAWNGHGEKRCIAKYGSKNSE